MLVDGFDEGIVDTWGDVVGEEGGFAGGGVVAGLGIEDIALDGGVVGGGEGLLVGFVLGVVGVEGLLADGALGGLEEAAEGGVTEFDLAAFFILEGGPLEIGV